MIEVLLLKACTQSSMLLLSLSLSTMMWIKTSRWPFVSRFISAEEFRFSMHKSHCMYGWTELLRNVGVSSSYGLLNAVFVDLLQRCSWLQSNVPSKLHQFCGSVCRVEQCYSSHPKYLCMWQFMKPIITQFKCSNLKHSHYLHGIIKVVKWLTFVVWNLVF